ncbi:MAG: hypothetical protein ACK2UR_13350, partial [Candidatus Promineifilaceae bacterium]
AGPGHAKLRVERGCSYNTAHSYNNSEHLVLDKVWFVGHNLRIRHPEVVIHTIIQAQTTKRPIYR